MVNYILRQMQSLIILGRQPKIGLAELESLYGGSKLRLVGEQATLLDIEPSQIEFNRLGGMVKFAKVLTVLDTASWKELESYLAKTIPKHLDHLPDGKLRLGLSVYDIEVSANEINKTGLRLKKIVQKSERSVRIVPNNEKALNAASVLHNKLTSQLGWELVVVKDEKQTILAQSIAVQDIEAYTLRDRSRPKRDMKVGMLPPKLAQIIINLAAGEAEPAGKNCAEPQSKNKAVLDPFCGTGVILQEAALMGYNAYGSDIEPRMVEHTKANMDWLGETFSHPPFSYLVEEGDAIKHQWDKSFDFVASEVYLGRAFSTTPKVEDLKQTLSDVNTIIKKFLKNLSVQTKSGFRLTLGLPAWKNSGGFTHLPILASLEELGYNRVSFVHASGDDLIYHREGQIVGRELVTLIRK